MQLNIHTLWTTPIIEVINPDHAKMKDGLVRHSLELERRAAEPIESRVAPDWKSRLYESRFDFFTRRDVPEVQALGQFCAETLSRTVLKLHHDATGGREPVPGVSVDLFESWVHVTRDGGYHNVHTHPNCSWCGIYYLEPADCTLTPPNGVNRFFAPIDMLYVDFGTLAYPQKPVTAAPTEGKLLLFPSYVRHEAIPYRGQRERIVVSFNARVHVANAQRPAPTAHP